MTEKPSLNREREKDASAAAAAFSQVSGILGGFSVTIVVLALSPSVISSDGGKDLVVGIVLLSAGLYIYSSGIFANAVYYADKTTKRIAFSSALTTFHVANISLSLGLLFLTFQFPLLIARIAATIITFFTVWVAMVNFPIRLSR